MDVLRGLRGLIGTAIHLFTFKSEFSSTGLALAASTNHPVSSPGYFDCTWKDRPAQHSSISRNAYTISNATIFCSSAAEIDVDSVSGALSILLIAGVLSVTATGLAFDQTRIVFI